MGVGIGLALFCAAVAQNAALLSPVPPAVPGGILNPIASMPLGAELE